VLATVRQLEAQVTAPFTVTTIAPILTRNDPEGLAPFYVVIGWVVGAISCQPPGAGPRHEPSLPWVLVRLGALAAFSVLSGILGSVLVGPAMHLSR